MPMQSRTDQVHSYQFFLQRVVSGLVAKESDPAELPFRRLGWSGFGSVMIAILVAAGFGIHGILVGGGNTSWRDGGSVIVEKDTGTAYLFREDRLHPMANLVSAQLALGTNEVVRVSARSLAGVPRGPVLGIPDAPAGLPDNGDLLTGGWTVCSEAVPDGQGGREVQSVVGVGRGPDGGAPLGDQQALLVRDAAAADGTTDEDGTTGGEAELHLVWRGHRFALAVAAQVLPVLGLSPEQALPVAAAWLDSVPVGDPIRPLPVDDPGEPSTALDQPREDPGVRAGQVIEAAGRFYLVRDRELQEITPLQRDVMLADPATADAYPDDGPPVVRELPPEVLANAVVQPRPELTVTSPPEAPPEQAPLRAEDFRDAAVCAAYRPGEFQPAVLAGARLAGWTQAAIPTPQRTVDGRRLVDQVLVAGGAAALVQAQSAPEAAGGALFLVTDLGLRYPLPTPEVAGWLGYQLDRVIRLPASLVARLPAGPVLDQVAAGQPIALPGR